jgi:glycosyltransferase involved in cell wall biosynthesis
MAARFVKHRCNGWRVDVHPAWNSGSFLEKCIGEPPINAVSQIVPSSAYARVSRFEFSGHIFFLKQALQRKKTDALKDWFRGSRARREQRSAERLIRCGFCAPTVAAVGKKGAECFIVTRAIDGRPLAEALKSAGSAAARRFLITQAGIEIRRLHKNGFCHGDLRWGNIFVRQDGSFAYLDNERTVKYPALLPFQKLKNLDQLNISAITAGLSTADRVRFFKAYRDTRSTLNACERRFLGRVERRSRWRLKEAQRRKKSPSSSKIKVLNVMMGSDSSIGSVAEEINRGLHASDLFDVTVLYLRARQSCLPESAADRKIGLGLHSRDFTGFRCRALRACRKVLEQNDYDAVITHRYKPAVLFMALSRSFKNIPLWINVVHGTEHYNKGRRPGKMARKSDSRWKFVAVSETVSRFLIDECGAAFTEKNTVTIQNGVDVKAIKAGLLSRSAARKELGLGENDFVFGSVGRLIKLKGVDTLLKAFIPIAGTQPHTKLLLIGDGEIRSELEQIREGCGLKERIVMPGAIPQGWRYLKALDVFVIFSDREGFPLALMEAMVAARSVIVSDIGPNRAIVGDEAVLIPPRDEAALKQAMEMLLKKDGQERDAYGATLRMRAENLFSIENMQRGYRNLIIHYLEHTMPKESGTKRVTDEHIFP